MTHEHTLPASPEEWADAIANAYGLEHCSHCRRELPPLLSISSALQLALPGLRSLLLPIRREYGPWAVIGLCLHCGDVAVWPITVEERQALINALTSQTRVSQAI